MNVNVVAIIPARGGSKSIPNKNIKLLGQHPLITYSIAVAKLSNLIEQVIVSTDSPEIAEISQHYGADVPFLRPKEISKDDSTDIEFFNHYLSFMENQQIEPPEYLVHLRPTTPLRKASVIDKAIETILVNSSATSLRSVCFTPISPYKIFKMEGVYLKGFFPEDPRLEYYNLPRQIFPKSYIPNGYVDIVRTSTIKTGMLHGNKMLGFVTEKIPDLDVPEDFDYAEEVLNDKRFEPLIKYMIEYYNNKGYIDTKNEKK